MLSCTTWPKIQHIISKAGGMTNRSCVWLPSGDGRNQANPGRHDEGLSWLPGSKFATDNRSIAIYITIFLIISFFDMFTFTNEIIVNRELCTLRMCMTRECQATLISYFFIAKSKPMDAMKGGQIGAQSVRYTPI